MEQVYDGAAYRSQDSTRSSWSLEFVRGSEGISDTTPTAWVSGDHWPCYEEVVTRLPLCGTTKLRAFVDDIKGNSTLSFGLIVPDNRRLRSLYKENGEHLRLTGKLWAWNSDSGQIFTKSFDSKNACGTAVQIMSHDRGITTRSNLSVYRDLKSKTVHFIVDGKEQKVSCCGNDPNFCFGYVRLSSKNIDSRIRVTLVPEVKDTVCSEKNSSSVESLPKKMDTCWVVVLGRALQEGFRWLMATTEPKQVDFTAQQKYRKLEDELEQEKLTCAKLKQQTREQAVQLKEEKLTCAKLKQETREQAVQLKEEKLTSAKLKQEIRKQAVQLQSYQVREASCLPRYKMEKRPRGMCVIINNVNFGHHGERRGAEFDEKALEQLFMDLLFKVHVFKDLQRNEMLSVAARFANNDHSNFDAFIFIVMSHGGNGDIIYGVKGRSARVEDLMSEFKAANCQTLRNKPKLFFIQTCRGSLNETLSPVFGDADVNSAPAFAGDSTLPRGVCPQEADFLLAFATAPGYKAWRIPETGFPFIQTLVEAIREHHHNHHILDILTEVNRRVVPREKNQRVPVQVPAPTHTLRRQLYL